MNRLCLALPFALLALTFSRSAFAETGAADGGATESAAPAAVAAPTAPAPAPPQSLVPTPAETPPEPSGKTHFEADPVGDGAILGISIGFAALSEALLSTGEIRPQQIRSNFDTNSLLSIDRGAISQNVDSSAGMLSTVGVAATVGFAVLDPVLSGFREDSRRAALVDGIVYGETLAITWGLTNLAKVAVRRPRPNAYIVAAQHRGDPTFDNADTDSSLSFFSGHAAISASMTATATYLAFARSPGTIRPWITLIAGSLITTFVSIERVRAGAHFPTDVVAGAMAGAGVGVLVPHLHREDTVKQRAVWVGFMPAGQGGTATLSGYF